MHPSPHYSALSSWVLLIAKAIDSYGYDSAELFAEAGLDFALAGSDIDRDGIQSRIRASSPGYFDTAGIALVTGRDFVPKDERGSEPVAIINQSLAERLTAGRSPIGRTWLTAPLEQTEVALERMAKWFGEKA